MARRSFGKYDGRKFGWYRYGRLLVIVVILTLIIFNVVVGVSRVSGNSMEPTLHDGQVVFFYRLAGHFSRGEIVSIKMPSGERYVKRVIATEGDTVDIADGQVTVNGQALEEPYARGATDAGDGRVTYPYKVEPGMIFVLGDNREASVDSRTFGPVVKQSVKGRILFR